MVEYDFSTMPDRRGHVLSMHALIGAYSPEGRAWMEQLKQVLETNIELAINFSTMRCRVYRFASRREPMLSCRILKIGANPMTERWTSCCAPASRLAFSGATDGSSTFHTASVWHWGCRQRSWKRRCGGSRTMFCKRSGTDGIYMSL